MDHGSGFRAIMVHPFFLYFSLLSHHSAAVGKRPPLPPSVNLNTNFPPLFRQLTLDLTDRVAVSIGVEFSKVAPGRKPPWCFNQNTG